MQLQVKLQKTVKRSYLEPKKQENKYQWCFERQATARKGKRYVRSGYKPRNNAR